MQVYIDSNIILDSMLNRGDLAISSRELLYEIAKNTFSAYISASSVTDIYYVAKRGIGKEEARAAIAHVIDLFHILDVEEKDCINAAASNIKDFEDALVVSVAKRHKMNCIVTRNVNDFTNAPLTILSPEEFLEKLKNK